MKFLNLNLPAPAEQLAADEALLDWCEHGHGGETLLFWEPREPFVVVGYGNKVASEVNVAACAARRIPIFRRCSGGGTILQMPGGLNYSLILRIVETGPTRSITSANHFIMEKNRAAFQTLYPGGLSQDPGPEISVRGHTDLCLGDLKFSGNSQRRRKNFLLFHGTLLLNCDLALIGELLPKPSLQPAYRASRPHEDFLANLNVPAAQVKAALQEAWNATEPFKNFPEHETRLLAEQKYCNDAWNLKF